MEWFVLMRASGSDMYNPRIEARIELLDVTVKPAIIMYLDSGLPHESQTLTDTESLLSTASFHTG